MPLFMVNRGNAQLSTTADLLTIVASATKPLRIIMAKISGHGSAPAANEVILQRSSGGGNPGGAITPEKCDVNANAASFLVYTTWVTPPGLVGGPLHRFEANANGGIDPFVAVPGGEIKVPVGGMISIRSASGTSNAIVNLQISEED